MLDEKKRFMLALIAPAVLVLVVFQILPILTGTNASFRDWHLHDPQKTWIGLTNYAYVLRDNEFLWIVLPNTFGFMFASVGCSLILRACMIALLLNRKFAGRWLVQTIILLPLMVAPVIAAIMIRWMFNDQFGIVNVILGVFGVPQIAWLTQKWTAFLAILLTDVWLWTPWFALLLLAGLAEPAARAVRGRPDRCGQRLAHLPLHHAADAAPGDRRVRRHPRHRRVSAPSTSSGRSPAAARRAPPRCSASTPTSRPSSS